MKPKNTKVAITLKGFNIGNLFIVTRKQIENSRVDIYLDFKDIKKLVEKTTK